MDSSGCDDDPIRGISAERRRQGRNLGRDCWGDRTACHEGRRRGLLEPIAQRKAKSDLQGTIVDGMQSSPRAAASTVSAPNSLARSTLLRLTKRAVPRLVRTR